MDWTGAVRPTNQPAMEQRILATKDTDRKHHTPHTAPTADRAPKKQSPQDPHTIPKVPDALCDVTGVCMLAYKLVS